MIVDKHKPQGIKDEIPEIPDISEELVGQEAEQYEANALCEVFKFYLNTLLFK